MPTIRPYRAEDLSALYEICLKTGAAGADASHLYSDAKAIGHVYAGPYGALEPESALVVESEGSVGGYIVGARDTFAFEKRLEAAWWPALRARYADPSGPPEAWSPEQRMAHLIHHPPRTPRRVTEPYPAHLHINLLPPLQGAGLGRALIAAWLRKMAQSGAKAAHLGVGPANARAVRFYRAFGFHEIERLPAPYHVIWFGISTA